jgi:phosphate:Na+ symporter
MSLFQYFILILTIAGSLGLFLYGMKLMSESILKLTGDRLRSILTSITAGRWRGLATGFVTTGIIQSSTAVTVLTVGLVNAGVVSLPGSISMMIGANIGTTITGWLVALIGFNLQMSTLSLIIIAFAIPIYLAGKRNARVWSECMIGFALLFIGLHLLRTSLPDIHENPEMIRWLSEVSTNYNNSPLLFLCAGTLITMILQSSSAVMSLTLVMASGSLITFQDAAGMIIGVNIGTTFSANLAAIVANRDARLFARSHFIFNLIGALWAFPTIPLLGKGIAWMLTDAGSPSPLVSASAMPVGLAIFHSLFNLVNSILLIGFIPSIQRLSSYLVLKPRNRPSQESKFQYLDSGLLSTSEISLVQVRKVIIQMFDLAFSSYNSIGQLLIEKDMARFKKIFRMVKKNEQKSDRMELEINLFLTNVSSGNLSRSAMLEIRKSVKIVEELKTIANNCMGMAKAIDTKKQNRFWFTQELRDNLKILSKSTEQLLAIAKGAFVGGQQIGKPWEEANHLKGEINNLHDQYRDDHETVENDKEYSYQAGIIYLTLVSGTEKIADQCMNILEAIENATDHRRA